MLSQLTDVVNSGLIHTLLNGRLHGIIHWLVWWPHVWNLEWSIVAVRLRYMHDGQVRYPPEK